MKARTVCCGKFVDTNHAVKASTKNGDEFLVCNAQCKKIVEMASPDQIKEMSTPMLG